MAESSIEKFIKNYINNKKISESKEGYEAWLRKNGVAPLSDFSESVAAASADYEKRASSYGSTAEHLAESGLTNSGYAKYLGDALKGKRNAAFENAISEYLETDSKNKVGYENELERLEEIRIAEEKKAEEERLKAEEKAKKEALAEEKKAAEKAEKEKAELLKNEKTQKEKKYNDAKKGLEKSGIINYERAYSFALEMGLDEDQAAYLAKSTTEVARNEAIQKVTHAIVSKTLTMKQTKRYALALGLSEEDATALSELAFKTNESVEDIVLQEEYLDYLRDKANKDK